MRDWPFWTKVYVRCCQVVIAVAVLTLIVTLAYLTLH